MSMSMSDGAVEQITIPLPDGPLGALRWTGGGPVVLALHGITANAMSWSVVGEALGGDVTLIAPDLRGRASSAGLPGPYGLRQHARDVVALMDHLDLETCVLAGHSMGAFVAATTATMFPERVRELVLVDGGVTLAVPAADDIDTILEAVIGPAMKRLRMTFASPGAYLDFWRAHPALAGWWSPVLEQYLLRDLVGEEPELRSSCVLEAIRADGSDTLVDPQVTTAARRIGCPATLLWAARGLLDETPGLYTTERLAAAGVLDGAIDVAPAVDANHYSILMGAEPARMVVDAIRRAVEAPAIDTATR